MTAAPGSAKGADKATHKTTGDDTGARARLFAVAVALTLLAWPVLTYFLLKPSGGGSAGVNDKLAHFVAFAVLVAPLAAARPRWALPVAALAVAYGGAIELIQPRFGRGAEWGDFVADLLGAALGAVLGSFAGTRAVARVRCRRP